MRSLVLCVLIIGAVSMPAFSQKNLLRNPAADSGLESWKIWGDAKVEDAADPSFAIRDGGYLTQIISLEDAAGKFALLIGRGSTDRFEKARILTGLPYLYGYLLTTFSPHGVNKINTYMSEQHLLGRPSAPNEWVVMYGIFEVPADTVGAQVMLMQAERNGEPRDGTTARFDEVGFFLFDKREDALAFAKKYR